MNLTRCILLGASLCAVDLQSDAGDWPQWRGPERTGYADSREQGPGSLPGDPKVFWRKDIGGGFSSPVISRGKLAYLDAHDGKEIAHLVDAATGKEIWQTVYGEMYEDEWGPGPRSTPILDDNRVYVQSCKGEFRCLNAENGKVVWGSQSDEAAYSSLMIATLAGVKQVVYYSADALMGVASDSGKLLWRVPLRTDAKRHASTPIMFDDSIVVNSQTIGLMCIKIARDGDALKAT